MMRSYQDGDCQILAAALQQITRWDVALVEGAGCHVVVATGDGQYLDSAGLRDRAELEATYGGALQHVGDIDDLGWLGTTPAVRDYRVAEQVLRGAGLLTEDHAERVACQIETLELFG